MPRALSAVVLILLFVTVGSVPLFAHEQLPCPPSPALMAPGQPAYEDAMALKKNLESQGMVVRCIFETKFSSEFLDWNRDPPRSTIEGETCFRTNLGDISVLFMWRPRTFAELKIDERHKGGWYVYSFSGMTDVWPRDIKHSGSKDRTYYFRRDNYLLSAGGERLRSAVEAALHQAPLSL